MRRSATGLISFLSATKQRGNWPRSKSRLRKFQADRAELAADTGPIRYFAALIGAGDEQAMRGFILLVSVLLDPLACALLLAATRRAS